MPFLQTITTVDPSLGRLDYDSLSDQTLMEMLIEGFTDFGKAQRYQDKNGSYLDVCEWPFIKCDANENVTEVFFSINLTQSRGSTIDFGFLPRRVTKVISAETAFQGTLNTAQLPPGLLEIDLEMNGFSGSVDLAALPRHMEHFGVTWNKFSGSLDLTHLPKTLKTLEVMGNKFEGSITLDELPESLTILNLGTNPLTGALSFAKLPPKLNKLSIEDTKFTGRFSLDVYYEALGTLNAWGTAFTGEAVLHSSYVHKARKVYLPLKSIEKCVDETGREIDKGQLLSDPFTVVEGDSSDEAWW